jgi:hypothetical protein
VNSTARLCARCKQSLPSSLIHPELCDEVVCDSCQRLYPPSLLKAAADYFDYVLRLSSGEIIRFCSAEINGDYVTLYGGDGSYDSRSLAACEQDAALPYSF